MSDEDLLSGAQAEINEMDQALLADDHDLKHEPVDDIDDLYDAAIEPSSAVIKRESVDSTNVPTSTNQENATTIHVPSMANISSGASRRFQLYVGNLTWWTTDDDITKAVESYGVTDFVEVKFAENRQNGQSRGFATITVGSEFSGKTLMERLPGRQIHGNVITVLPFNKTSLQRLEEASKSSGPQEKKDEKSNIPNLGTVRIGGPRNQVNMNRPMQQMGQMNGMMQQMGSYSAPMNMMPMQQQQMMQQNRPMMGGMSFPASTQAVSNASAAQAMNSLFRNQQTSMAPPGTGNFPAGAHINPQVYPNYQQYQQRPQDMSSVEFEEIMTRNKSVSSSAITRAMNDAADGDISSAVSTLNTAINLIKQSKVAGEESCKSLIRTLEDALSSVESRTSSSRKHRHRSPSGSPPSRRRSRSRERSSRDSRSHRHSKRSRDF